MSHLPYPGLRPFEKSETDIFFGRDTHTDQLIERLGMNAETEDKPPYDFLAVIGPSGCGKSSLVNAGLLAGLETGFLAKAGPRWRIVKLRPGNQPFTNLAAAMLQDEEFGRRYSLYFSQHEQVKAPTFLEAELRRGPQSLSTILQHTPLPPKNNLLLLIDQFEEIFRYPQSCESDDMVDFVGLLLESCRYPAIYIVITMRSDFLGACTRFAGLAEAINKGLYLIPRLNREQLRTAIEAPARVFGSRVEPALINRLLNEMGQDPDGLPVLQHALMRIWDLKQAQRPANNAADTALPLDLADLEAIGTLENALSKHADEAYAELNPTQQQIAQVLFRRLIVPETQSGSPDMRHAVKLGEIAELADTGWEEVAAVVKVFRQEGRGFLTPRVGTPLTSDSMVDISHESLIRKWKLLKSWAKQETKSADQYLRLESTARLWKEKEASLLHKLDLGAALAWRKKTVPTANWAKRYGGDFPLTLRFLEASEKLHQIRRIAFGVAVGLIIASIFILWGYDENIKAKHLKQVELINENRTKELFESRLTEAVLLDHGEEYTAALKPLRKTKDLDTYIPQARRTVRNLVDWHRRLMGGEPRQKYQLAGAPLLAVAVNIEANLLAAAGERGVLALFNIDSPYLKQRLIGHDDDINNVYIYPQGKRLISGGIDGKIIFWTLPDGTLFDTWQESAPVIALAVSPDGQRLAVATYEDKLALRDIASGKEIQVLEKDGAVPIFVGGLVFNHTGDLLAGATIDNTAHVWNTATGKRLWTSPVHNNVVTAVCFSPDDKILATASADYEVRLWEAVTGEEPIRVLRGHKEAVYDLAFTPDSAYLISGSTDRKLRIWDVQSGVTLRVLQDQDSGGINALAMSVNGEDLFSAGDDGLVRHWKTGLPYQQHLNLKAEPTSTAIAPNLDTVAIGFADGSLRLYHIPPALPTAPDKLNLLWEEQQAHTDRIQRLAFDPNGRWIASASLDYSVKLWDVEARTQHGKPLSHDKGVNGVAFSADGRLLASAGYDGKINLLTVQTGKVRKFTPNMGDIVKSVVFDRNSDQVLTTGEAAVRLWDISEWHTTMLPDLVQEYPPSKDNLMWSVLSPNGQQIASVGRGSSVVHVYSSTVKDTKHELFGHQETIFKVLFSPNGQQVVTLSGDATIRLWDIGQKQGRELFVLPLSAEEDNLVPAYDFDFRCATQRCRVAVPLRNGELVIYDMDKMIYTDRTFTDDAE